MTSSRSALHDDEALFREALAFTAARTGFPARLIEISLREELLLAAEHGAAQTLLLDPISGEAATPAIGVLCVTRSEAMAEKLRAALCRRDPAIRDFFDVDYAVRWLDFDVHEPGLLKLVASKLAVPGTEPVDISADRLAALRPQVEGQLRPVLRPADFNAFDLERAFRTIADLAAELS